MEAGFTLVELMVVVILIALLAIIAIPSMRTAQDDRRAFDYARQYSSVIHRASVRATARGAAHLVVIDAGGIRGHVRLFEAVDGTAPPSGPRQVTSCKVPGQWAGAAGWAPGAADPVLSPFVDGLSLDTAGVNVDMNIGSKAFVGGAQVNAIVVCYTPGGNVYVGSGGNVTAAIAAMQVAQPFTGVADVQIQRRNAGGAGIGLTRRVIVGGAGAPRIQSI
jgi:type IV fimbrial biogenesis protein FimT